MAAETYRGVGGVNRKIKEMHRSVSGVNRKVKEVWRGVNGVNRTVFSTGPVYVTCTRCNGSGRYGTCSACDGSGRITWYTFRCNVCDSPGGTSTSSSTWDCPSCVAQNRNGKMVVVSSERQTDSHCDGTGKETCSTCKGTGQIEVSE